MTGPYTSGNKRIKLWDGVTASRSTSANLTKEFRDIEAWFKLTTSKTGEFFPDVWIAGGDNQSSKFESHAAVPASDKASLVQALKALRCPSSTERYMAPAAEGTVI